MYKKEKRDIRLFIVDLLVAVEKICNYIDGFEDKEEFRQNSLHWDASMHQLEIVGESLNKLLDDEQFHALSPKYFRKVVNFRNVIAPGYFGIDLDEVWDVVTNKLDMLKNDVLSIIVNKIDITEAIEATIIEKQKLNDIEIVDFLNTLLKETLK